ncbi:N-acetylmuramoyl-L-alanine amidase [Flavobacterium sp. MFBS3-15]|uniref:N-acetylmuramoyl-L-alanine amidase family protein n=1 Tax=Flavobacterium sp. MFBS3-15 TaxID=2989816 RepID=UPI00223685D5|nr:N-acetylmuramoyl-L-alanine amidase [Flavobacterium sp. MFBS3-15]MCW4470266.1 N-acetylmuramoyl-L-alanine amidase [Flavobacterium sp. MFBS3-15]
MKGMKLRLAFITLLACCGLYAQGNSKFRVVLDPGHGAKDYGVVYHGFIEKNIVLNVALKVGKILEKEGVQVVYTRKSDVFVELDERHEIANRSNADVFVSLHCNGEPKKLAFGTEAFVMGATKNASHLEVAKRENSVIKLESDREKYQGFDPNKPETLAGIKPDDELLNKSIDLASRVEERFTDDLKRKKRGVKQAPFWVLHNAKMPGILIEMGFLSYKPEGEYLNSDEGQDELAESIAKAILSYKKEYFVPGTVDYSEPKTETKEVAEVEKTVKPAAATVAAASKGDSYRVQIAASGKDLELVPSNFNGLNNITKEKGASVIKYFYGEATDREEAKVLLSEAKAKGYTSAFIATFRDGKRI